MGGVSGSRERPAQLGPPEDLTGFPQSQLRPGHRVYRAHLVSQGPWWFGSGGGRFDLDPPRGTCYLASTALAAIRERLGPVLAGRRTVPRPALADVVVSRLTVTEPGGSIRLANLRSSRAAEFGVTRELESMTPYDVPRAWARAWDAAGLDGVRYGPRFSPGRASAYAVFGPQGEDVRRGTDPAPVAASAVSGVPGLVPLPRRAHLTVIGTPRRRAPRQG